MWPWLIGILFPIQCLGCGTYDVWLCAHCIPDLPGEYHHPVLKKALHIMKYGGGKPIAVILGQTLAHRIPEASYDVIVPVPMYWKKRWARGYNQAQIIAEQFPKPVWPALKKIRATQAQATLNRQDRLKNLTGSFTINQPYAQYITGRRVLLIDDVYTTGTTTQLCTNLLYQAGAKQVQVAVLAYSANFKSTEIVSTS
ncbi:MAG: phosphoribosyltransferase family protein [Patescibacteria group bacterium]|jgi:ComF family protein